MKANILQKSVIAFGVMGGLMSLSSQAADEVVSFSFETIVDVSIVQTQALDFGADLSIVSTETCTLVVNNTPTGRPGSIAANEGLAVPLSEGTAFQTRTGECDTDGNGTVGIYTITGAPGVEVTITLNPVVAAGGNAFAFAPAGVVVDYNAATTDDILTDVASGVPLDIDLAAAGDFSASGTPVPGQTLLFVGGLLTNNQTLTAGTTYNTQTYVIDVIY